MSPISMVTEFTIWNSSLTFFLFVAMIPPFPWNACFAHFKEKSISLHPRLPKETNFSVQKK